MVFELRKITDKSVDWRLCQRVEKCNTCSEWFHNLCVRANSLVWKKFDSEWSINVHKNIFRLSTRAAFTVQKEGAGQIDDQLLVDSSEPVYYYSYSSEGL